MFRGLVLAVAIVGLTAVGLVGGQQAAEAQQTASATRSLPSEVEGGGTLTVTISVADYGGLGQLTETFPGDFTFEGSSPAVEPSGQTLTFNLLADASVSYTLRAPTTTETISISGFSGTLEPAVGDGVTVDGPSSVTISAPARQQTASATRSLPSEVEGGGTLTVTISVADYGGLGQLTETFPGDFTFEGSSPAVEPSGQTLTFNLLADASVSYTLRAPTTTETISISGFSGTLEPAVGDGVTVDGPSSVTISAPARQQTASATRSLPSEVEGGGTLTVTISVADYGGIGQLTETFPGDFTFEGSSPEVEPSGQTLTFNLLADPSVSYTLRAPTTTETISISGFSGTLEPEVEDGVTVGGPSSVTVSAPAQQTASATRSFSPSEVEPDEQLVVTISVADYGGIGQLTETFPGDFAFEGSSPEVEPSGQTLTFNLLADRSVSYTLRAPTTTETISISGFSGTLEPEVEDGVTVRGPSSVTVRVVAPEPQVNRAPVFPGSSTTRSIDENSTSGANVGTPVTASDPDRDTLTYSVTGTDAGSFTINSGTGQITVGAGTTLDYETKASYMVTVGVTDGSEDDSIDVTITVTNVVELGMVSGDATAEYAENGMEAVATYTADGPVTAGWSVSGADMDDFGISNEGVLSFASAPDFEAPADADTNNVYMVTVKAEAGGEMDMVDVTVMVTNVDEIGTLSGPETVSNYMENSEDPVGTYTVSGGSMSEMANLTLEGDDAGDFSISSAGVLSFRSSPDFENPTDADMDNTYMVTVKAEAGGEMAMQPVTVTVTNVDETTEPEPDTLMERYDTNKDGEIQKSEVITAINDYLFGEVGIISKADVIRLINLYLFG